MPGQSHTARTLVFIIVRTTGAASGRSATTALETKRSPCPDNAGARALTTGPGLAAVVASTPASARPSG